MNTAQNGKGDAPRPVNMTRYGENYDAIFRKEPPPPPPKEKECSLTPPPR